MEKRRLRRTIADGLQYILKLQSADGSWVDWDLPPGPSDMWTTAFVGWKLCSAGVSETTAAKSAIRRASGWLLGSVMDDWGWGYNASMGSDADSTAYAILFLSSQDKTSIPPACYTRLRQFQSPDGGFSTYCPCGQDSSWVVSHPDVTPLALLGLLTKFSPQELFIRKGLGYVLKHRTSAGFWNSFWWNSCLYSTSANLALLDTLGLAVEKESMLAALLHTSSLTPFEAALQLRCISFVNAMIETPTIHRIVERLIREQAGDGSWRSKPILRVTDRACFAPWDSCDAGKQFADPNNLFTTATIVEALSMFSRRGEPAMDQMDTSWPSAI